MILTRERLIDIVTQIEDGGRAKLEHLWMNPEDWEELRPLGFQIFGDQIDSETHRTLLEYGFRAYIWGMTLRVSEKVPKGFVAPVTSHEGPLEKDWSPDEDRLIPIMG